MTIDYFVGSKIVSLIKTKNIYSTTKYKKGFQQIYMITQFNTELQDLLPIVDNLKFENMTQEQFQLKLEVQRLRTTSTSDDKLKKNDGIRKKDDCTKLFTYNPTQDQYYRIFINDILRNIRSGGADYCYRWYQVKELLRFHKHSLQCRMVRENGNSRVYYFIVSLQSNWRLLDAK